MCRRLCGDDVARRRKETVLVSTLPLSTTCLEKAEKRPITSHLLSNSNSNIFQCNSVLDVGVPIFRIPVLFQYSSHSILSFIFKILNSWSSTLHKKIYQKRITDSRFWNIWKITTQLKCKLSLRATCLHSYAISSFNLHFWALVDIFFFLSWDVFAAAALVKSLRWWSSIFNFFRLRSSSNVVFAKLSLD